MAELVVIDARARFSCESSGWLVGELQSEGGRTHGQTEMVRLLGLEQEETRVQNRMIGLHDDLTREPRSVL